MRSKILLLDEKNSKKTLFAQKFLKGATSLNYFLYICRPKAIREKHGRNNREND